MLNLLYRLTDLVDERKNPRNYQIFLLVLFVALVLGALMSSASADRVAVAGLRVPLLCPFKTITGLDCPGCGITRSLVLALHGRFHASFLMHLWGIPLALLAILQVPYRLYLIFGGRAVALPSLVKVWFGRALFLSLLIPWALKLVARFL